VPLLPNHDSLFGVRRRPLAENESTGGRVDAWPRMKVHGTLPDSLLLFARPLSKTGPYSRKPGLSFTKV